MAFDLSPYMAAIAIGGQVSTTTGNVVDALPAGSYAGLVQSITGSLPTVIELGNNRVRLVLTQVQANQMRAWLESQVSTLLQPSKTPSSVEYAMGPVINPILLKYTIPVAALLFVVGFIAAKTVFK